MSVKKRLKFKQLCYRFYRWKVQVFRGKNTYTHTWIENISQKHHYSSEWSRLDKWFKSNHFGLQWLFKHFRGVRKKNICQNPDFNQFRIPSIYELELLCVWIIMDSCGFHICLSLSIEHTVQSKSALNFDSYSLVSRGM